MKELFVLLKPYVNKHRKYFGAVTLAAFVAALSQTLIPVAIGLAIDNILSSIGNQSPQQSIKLLRVSFFILLGLAVLDLLAQSGQRFAGVRFAQHVVYDIRQDLFRSLQEKELDFYAKETTGQIMSRSIEEIFSFREILTWGYRITIMVSFLFLGAIIAMLRLVNNIGTLLLAFVFILIPIVIFFNVMHSSSRNRQYFYNSRFKYGEMSEQMAENLNGIHTVKSMGREAEQVQIFNVKNQEFFKARLKVAWVRATIMPQVVFIIGTSLIVLVFLGGYLISINSITAGDFTAFLLLSLQIALPGRFLGFVGIFLQDANSAAIRLNEIFKAETHVKEKEDAYSLRAAKGEISFQNVSFDYPSTHHTLHNISLNIPSGQKIALLGPTGAGKSTLINLIPRFYDPQAGDVYIDGHNVKDLTLTSLRNHIGIVHQDAFLFTMSLHDNIAFGNPDATRDEVVAVAKAAQIHDFINGLSEGYDTIVGERGVTLSGGQRQRVTIARALLQNPAILIFDDSVSSVDPKTEAQIQENLKQASKDRTTIIISQRPSSLRYVDRIVVIDEGHITQDGTHEKLMEQEGIYQEFIEAVTTQVKFMDWDSEELIQREVK